MKTSFTDERDYKNMCNLFVRDDEIFKVFRNYNRIYNRVLEHVTDDLGRKYLNEALKKAPFLNDSADRIRINDMVGSPQVYYYDKFGKLSPTTLRYTKVMSDIYSQIKSLKPGNKIIEIGGGYGGQCRIMSEFMDFKQYTQVDLLEVCKLQEKYLSHFDPINVRYVMPEDVIDLKEEIFDFVISNFAFNELCPEYQKMYYNNIIQKSSHGYISGVFNRPQGMSIDNWGNRMSIIDWDDRYNIRVYEPNINHECHIITW